MATQDKTQRQPSSALAFVGRLSSADTVTRTRANVPQKQTTEPTMRALRRILGEQVLDIFPDGLIEATDKMFEYHKTEPDDWAMIQNETVQERDDLLKLMRAYAECAGESGYTIRQDRTAEPTVLRIRVVPRKGSGKQDEEETDS